MGLKRHVTVVQAIEHVSRNAEPSGGEPLQMKAWELVTRRLFEIALNPDSKSKAGMRKAALAQKVIAERMGGARRAGSTPIGVSEGGAVEFVDLTK